MEVSRPPSSPERGPKAPSALAIAWRWVGVLVLAALAVWLAWRGLPDNRLHVYFLDVGQGDAILVRAPDGRTILVDGGPSPTALLNQIGEVLPFWDRSLDLVVLTHPDQDHLTGLIPLLDRYRIGQVLDVVEFGRGPNATLWLEAVTESEVTRTSAGRGARLPLGQLQVTILNPQPNSTMDATRDDNSGSIVLRLDYGQTSALLAGDADQQAEDDMLTAGLPLATDILKVGHHGSKFSSSAAFLAAVSPRVAVIQVGADNPFGHPDLEVLARLAGSQVFRTDQEGRIEAISDGVRWRIETER